MTELSGKPTENDGSKYHPSPTGECLKSPSAIIRPPLGNASSHHPSPLGNASSHHPSPTGECLKPPSVPHWGMPQAIIRPPLGNASSHHPSPTIPKYTNNYVEPITYRINRLSYGTNSPWNWCQWSTILFLSSTQSISDPPTKSRKLRHENEIDPVTLNSFSKFV